MPTSGLQHHEAETPDVRHELVAFTSICFFVCFLASIFFASYFNKGTIQNVFSYVGADGPAGYANSVKPKELGVHLFGDYLLPRWQSELNSPWFISDPSSGPVNNYLPFTMAVFWLFGRIAYWKSFILFMSIGIGTMLTAIWFSIQGTSRMKKLQFISAGVLVSGPFIALIDRGNIQILLTALCCLSLSLWFSNRKTLGAIALGFAVALKGYPILLLLLWIRERRWKDCIISLSTIFVVTIAPLFFYSGGVFTNLSRILRNVRSNEELYAHQSLAYNNSLKGTLLSIESLNIPLLGTLASFCYEHALILTLGLVFIFCGIALSKLTTTGEVILICVALMTICVDYVGAYAVSLYFLVFMIADKNLRHLSSWKLRLIFFATAVALAPKYLPIRFWTQSIESTLPTYGSLLGGFCGLLILFVISLNTFQRFSERFSGPAAAEFLSPQMVSGNE
jgi:hypothetical protein